MGVSVIVLKFINFIVGFLPNSKLEDIPVIENIVDVTNIFAWANYFLPSTVILTLLTITAAIYLFKGFYNILKDFIF